MHRRPRLGVRALAAATGAAALAVVLAPAVSAATGSTPLRAVLNTVRIPAPENVRTVAITIAVADGADRGRATVVLSGLADDSVRAIRRRLVLTRLDSGAWRARVRLEEYRCARGGSDEWQTELCP